MQHQIFSTTFPDNHRTSHFMNFAVESFQLIFIFYVTIVSDYGVDKYDIGTGFGHFGIAVDDVSFPNFYTCYHLILTNISPFHTMFIPGGFANFNFNLMSLVFSRGQRVVWKSSYGYYLGVPLFWFFNRHIWWISLSIWSFIRLQK